MSCLYSRILNLHSACKNALIVAPSALTFVQNFAVIVKNPTQARKIHQRSFGSDAKSEINLVDKIIDDLDIKNKTSEELDAFRKSSQTIRAENEYDSSVVGYVGKGLRKDNSYFKTDKIIHSDDKPPPPAQIDKDIGFCETPVELWNLVSNQTLLPSQYVIVLENLTKWDSFETSNSKEFDNLCWKIQFSIESYSLKESVLMLKYLLLLGVARDQPLVNLLEQKLNQNIRVMHIGLVAYCLTFHKNYEKAKLKKATVKALISTLSLRWFEIKMFIDLFRVLSLSHFLDPQVVYNIHEHALTVVPSLKFEELSRLLTVLAETNQRPDTLIRSILYHIMHNKTMLTISDLVKLATGLNKLNFHHSDFMDRIVEDLLPKVSNITKSSQITLFLISFGNLQYFNEALLEEFTKWIGKHMDMCRNQDLCALIMTLARLNYIPKENASVLDAAISKLSARNVPPKFWLDVVWSLVILQKAGANHLAPVLKPSFYRRLVDGDNYFSSINKLKLLNIAAAAKYEISGYSGPFLNDPELFKNAERTMREENESLTATVMATLSRILVPAEKNMELKTDIMSSSGINIVTEFVVDSEAKHYSSSNIKDSEEKGILPLPQNQHRIAILPLMYRDVTMNTGNPIGINAFAHRILKKLGYKIVEVRGYEFVGKSEDKRTQVILQNKILKAIKSSDSKM